MEDHPLTESPSQPEALQETPPSPASIGGSSQSPQTTTSDLLKTKPLRGEDSHSTDRDGATKVLEEMEPVPATPPLQSALSNGPAVTGSPQSKGIVMGSFSERLKKIRESRSSRRGSPSLKTSTSQSSAAEKLISTKQTSASDITTTPSPLTASLTTSPALSVCSTSSSFSYGGDSTPSMTTLVQQTNNFDEKFAEALRSNSSEKYPVALAKTSGTDHTAQASMTASFEKVEDAHESTERYKLQDMGKHLHTDVSHSSINSETAASEKTDTSKDETQDDTGQSLPEDTPHQLNKKSLTIDLDLPPENVEVDDELPTAPPPPIPDLPPPPDDLHMDSSTEDKVDTTHDLDPSVVEAVSKEDGVTTKTTKKSSFRTIRKKEEWTRKSEALDSTMFEPLPLLVFSTKSRIPDPVPEEGESSSQQTKEETSRHTKVTKSPTDNDILHGSSESLPSLPESPPPQLPDGPPPDLPTFFPPDGMEIESELMEEGVVISETLLIPSLEVDEDKSENVPPFDTDAPVIEFVKEASPSQPHVPSPTSIPQLENKEPPRMDSEKVQLRKPKQAINGASPRIVDPYRRSAFDALVAVEPTTEEKKEPKLSAEQRRSMALESSRRSNADTSPFLERWNRTSPSVELNAKMKKGDSDVSIPTDHSEKEESENERSLENKEDFTSQTTQRRKGQEEFKLLTIEGHSRSRPRSVAGVDDLQVNTRHIKGDESRWSLPPDSDVFQAVNVKATSELPSSIGNDHKFTSGTMEKWKNTQLLSVSDNPSLSASAGQLFGRDRDRSQGHDGSQVGRSTGWHSLHSSSESLPPFIGLKKSPNKQRLTRGISPLAATVSSATPGASKEESISQIKNSENTELHDQESSSQQISYAEKLQVQSRASARKRRSLVLSEDDQTAASLETAHTDNSDVNVPLRRKNVKNLQLSSIKADYLRPLDSPRPASLVLDRDILKVFVRLHSELEDEWNVTVFVLIYFCLPFRLTLQNGLLMRYVSG